MFSQHSSTAVYERSCVCVQVQKEYKHCMRKAPCLPECLKVSYGTATPIAASPNQSADNSSNVRYFVFTAFCLIHCKII